MRDKLNAISGHAWTILPTVRHQLAARPVPKSVEWTRIINDPEAGEVILRGRYSAAGGDTLLISVHGLGGSPDSPYHGSLVREAATRGWSTLRIALRGTDGIGNDFYHAGLTADLHAALADQQFAGYDRIFVAGYSLGGHLTLCLGAEEPDPRVAALAAICPPVDLSAGASGLDGSGQALYRHHILAELKRIYRGVAKTASVPTPWERIRRVRKIREWDALTIVPRFGFANIEDYYHKAGVAHRIEQIARPTLMIHSRHDPVVLPETVYPVIERAPESFEAHWFDGAGHVFFPPNLHIGESAEAGLGPQVAAWLDRQ